MADPADLTRGRSPEAIADVQRRYLALAADDDAEPVQLHLSPLDDETWYAARDLLPLVQVVVGDAATLRRALGQWYGADLAVADLAVQMVIDGLTQAIAEAVPIRAALRHAAVQAARDKENER